MPCRKYSRRNAVHILVPYSTKPQACNAPMEVDEEEDYSLAYAFARTSIDDGSDPDYSPASQPKSSFRFGSFGYSKQSSDLSDLYLMDLEEENDEYEGLDLTHHEGRHVRSSTFGSSISSYSALTASTASSVQSSLPKRRTRAVRFDESLNVYHENNQNPCYALWYSRKDNDRFLADRAVAIDEIAYMDKTHTNPYSYRKVLQRTYEACCRVVHETETDNINQGDDNGGALTAAEQAHLNRCLALNSTRIGMESTMAVPAIAIDEHSRYYELLNVVTNNASAHASNNHDEYIRRACEALSRPSRLFARHIAQAQTACLQ